MKIFLYLKNPFFQRMSEMNKIKRIMCFLLLVVLTSVLSGCYNATYTLKLKNNGNMDVNMSVLFDSESKIEIPEELIKEFKQKFIDIGYSVKDITELALNGFSISKEDIPQVGDGFVDKEAYNIDLLDDIMYNMEFDEKARCNTYELDADVDLTSFLTIPDVISDKVNAEEFTKLLSAINLKMVIELEEGTITSSNSTNISADKKRAEWVLIPGSVNKIQMNSVMGVNTAWISSMIIVGVILAISAALLIILIRMYNKKREQ